MHKVIDMLFGEAAPLLSAQGYDVVPIKPGTKAPRPTQWQHGGFAAHAALYSNDYTGILTRETPSVDIDVSDAELVRQTEAIVMDVLDCHELPPPARIGMAPRRLLTFRTDEPFGKLQTAEYSLPTDPVIDGKQKYSKVEILADGQQFVAIAIHPNTKQPYSWNGGGTPLTVAHADLVPLNWAQAVEIVARADALLALHGTPINKTRITQHPGERKTGATLRADDPTLLRSALDAIPNEDEHFDDWVAMLYAVKAALGDDAAQDFLAWSRKSTKHDEDFARAEWRKARPMRRGAGSIYWLAERNGWVRPKIHVGFGPAEDGGLPKPVDIFRGIVAPPLDPKDFPAELSHFALAIAHAAGHDPSAYLMTGLAAVAAAISDEVQILIDPRTSWFESARLWVLLLGAPGSAKTPAIRAAMRPLFAMHKELRDAHAKEVAACGKDDEKPPSPSIYTNDPTVEALSEVLVANPRGVIAVFEELDSWIGSHDAYRGGQGSKDRGEWLRLFDGGPHQVDRVKRGSIFVKNWGCSILGATTPAGLKRHSKNLPADGLIQRFLPVIVRPMVAPDNNVETVVVAGARSVFEEALAHVFAVHSGTVRLTPGAAALFFKRRDDLRDEIEAVCSLSEPMAGHIAKHAGLTARVALAFHCLENGSACAEVLLAEETMRKAINLMHKLTRHALSMFDTLSAGDDSSMTIALAAARSILANRATLITRRELMRGCRAFRDAPDGVRDSALRFLTDAAWLSPVDDGRKYAGRQTEFDVNPLAHSMFSGEGEALRRRRAVVREIFK